MGGAKVRFECGLRENAGLVHTNIANDYVQSLGYRSIGYNWELLDAEADGQAPRSAIRQIAEALSHELSNPSKDWLPAQTASACASDFLALFDPAGLTVVSNRYDGLWNPIAGFGAEWCFVGFDEQCIAMLLLTEA